MDRAVILTYLCENPSCELSEQKIVHKTVMKINEKKSSFENLTECPKCKEKVELLKFNSGSIEIIDDFENQEE